MTKSGKHRWTFPARFRTGAYGWKASKLACKRVREAVGEIQRVARRDPVLAGEGAVRLMEKLWPALEKVDTSSGALGNTVNKAVEALVQIVIDASADAPTRSKWLDRLWQAMEEDGVDYLAEAGARWGELCGSREVAAQWGERLLPYLRMSWGGEWGDGGRYYGPAPACLSCLVTCGRYDEVLELIDAAPYVTWHYRRYGVQALAAMGRIDEAVDYARASVSAYDAGAPIADACEQVLLAAGRTEDAYRDWALGANLCGTNLATFRAIAKKYPHKEPAGILSDLIQWTAGDEGRWFATAKALGLLDLAADLPKRSPCDPKTLNRAARDHREDNPKFALDVALASLRWLTEGHGYEVTALDVVDAFRTATQAAEKLGRTEEAAAEIGQLLKSDGPATAFVRQVLERRMEAMGDWLLADGPEGDCYVAAYEAVAKMTEGTPPGELAEQDVFLVHGSVVPQVGPDAGRRIDHAWVETGDQTIEVHGGRSAAVARDHYYEVTQARVRVRYNPFEALTHLLRNRHYGPWDI